jgi:DNA-binding MarR family transcriptional regulator
MKTRTNLRAKDYEALGAYRYAMRKFLRFSKEVLAAAKLTPAQYEALLALKTHTNSKATGMNVGELSERLQVKHHTAVSLLDKLAARRLVDRRRASEDKRQVHVKLTSLGDSILARLAGTHRRELRHRSSEMINALRRLQK